MVASPSPFAFVDPSVAWRFGEGGLLFRRFVVPNEARGAQQFCSWWLLPLGAAVSGGTQPLALAADDVISSVEPIDQNPDRPIVQLSREQPVRLPDQFVAFGFFHLGGPRQT